MRSDRIKVTPTDLAQMERCERQVLFDAQRGQRRSVEWKERAAAGRASHAEIEATLVAGPNTRGLAGLLRGFRTIVATVLGAAFAAALLLFVARRFVSLLAGALS